MIREQIAICWQLWLGMLLAFITLPLKELRRRQNITYQQIQTTYRQIQDRREHHRLVALNKLQDMADSLTEAVYLTEWE